MKKAAKYTYLFHRIFMGLILALSVVGAIINEDASVKSIYVFNATESLLFLIASLTPTVLKKLHFEIPDVVYLILVLFMSAHFLMGEILGFYATVSWWDSVLHTFSGVLLTFLSFALISFMSSLKHNGFKLNIYFSALFAFSLTITIGVFWEIIEFASDSLFNSNMQRAYESLVDAGRGAPLLGQEALLDTMKDLILDATGSALTCGFCVILYKTKKIDLSNMSFIKRVKPVNFDENGNIISKKDAKKLKKNNLTTPNETEHNLIAESEKLKLGEKSPLLSNEAEENVTQVLSTETNQFSENEQHENKPKQSKDEQVENKSTESKQIKNEHDENEQVENNETSAEQSLNQKKVSKAKNKSKN